MPCVEGSGPLYLVFYDRGLNQFKPIIATGWHKFKLKGGRVAEWFGSPAPAAPRFSARGCGFEPHRGPVTRLSPPPGLCCLYVILWTMAIIYTESEINADMDREWLNSQSTRNHNYYYYYYYKIQFKPGFFPTLKRHPQKLSKSEHPIKVVKHKTYTFSPRGDE